MVPCRDRSLRLRCLWQCWFLALLFHTDLGLMPLFHGLPVAIESQVNPGAVPLILWAMLAYSLVPLASLILITYAETAANQEQGWWWWRPCHLWLSLLYTLTNACHLGVDMVIPDSRGDQVVLMAVMLAIGLLINREALLWCRGRRGPHSMPLPIGARAKGVRP
jgi:hypothetical protein